MPPDSRRAAGRRGVGLRKISRCRGTFFCHVVFLSLLHRLLAFCDPIARLAWDDFAFKVPRRLKWPSPPRLFRGRPACTPDASHYPKPIATSSYEVLDCKKPVFFRCRQICRRHARLPAISLPVRESPSLYRSSGLGCSCRCKRFGFRLPLATGHSATTETLRSEREFHRFFPSRAQRHGTPLSVASAAVNPSGDAPRPELRTRKKDPKHFGCKRIPRWL